MSRDSRWRIYYDDGKVFSSEDGSFEDAPIDGVLYVIEKREEGRVLVHSGHDFYAMIDGEIVAPEDIGALLRLVKWIKHGRWTSFRRFDEVGRRVAADIKGWERGD